MSKGSFISEVNSSSASFVIVVCMLLGFQFASRAKKIKNKPIVNEVLSDEAMLRRYQKEIDQLKKQLENVSITQNHDKALNAWII